MADDACLRISRFSKSLFMRKNMERIKGSRYFTENFITFLAVFIIYCLFCDIFVSEKRV